MPSTQNRAALVLGATGGIGGETATALARHGWHVRALTRNPEGKAARSHPDWEWVRGDSMDNTSVVGAAAGVPHRPRGQPSGLPQLGQARPADA